MTQTNNLNQLNDEMLQYFETVVGIKPQLLKYLFEEYPTSYYDYETNSIYIKGKSVEQLTYFILGDTDLININDTLPILQKYGINAKSTQTVRNYINKGKLPNPILYIGRFAYFDKQVLINHLEGE